MKNQIDRRRKREREAKVLDHKSRKGSNKCNYSMNLPMPSSSGKLGAWTRGTIETDDISTLLAWI